MDLLLLWVIGLLELELELEHVSSLSSGFWFLVSDGGLGVWWLLLEDSCILPS